MFKLAATAATLITASNASFSDISAGLDNSTAPVGPGLRSFAPNGGTWGFMGAAIVASIKNYGCWCYFDSIGNGKSDPVDTIDGYCKTLQQGYECAALDNAACVPYEHAYTKPGLFGMNEFTVKTACETLNAGDQCAIDSCTVETWFVMQMMNGGEIAADEYKHDNNGGTFDVSASCPITTGVTGDKTCCGDQPARFAYKSFSGARKCCGTATFDATIAECCDEGGEAVVRLFGLCMG